MPSSRSCRRRASLLIHAVLATGAHAFSVPTPTKKPPLNARTDALPPALERPATVTVAGATALVSGTTIGAGILALPATTIEAGFGPSALTLIASWAYMAASALLIAEVNVNTLCSLERNSVSIKSMAGETIGPVGATAASVAYAFIHYCLLVAYMLEGGKLLIELVPALGAAGLPDAAVFAALGGGALLVASTSQADKANSALFTGVVGSFALLVGVGASQISPQYLAHASPAAALPAIPVCVLAFTFHNIVPTIAYQLGCDLAKIRTAILAGSAIPLVMFLLWNGVILGSVPFEAAEAARSAGEVFDPLEALRQGASTGGAALGSLVRVFSLLAIATSFIGFCFGLVDFYADLLGIDGAVATAAGGADDADDDGADPYADGGAAVERPLPTKAGLYALALLPPLGVATVDPSLFFSALDNAGTFGILTLFGIIPAAMAWSQRYGADAAPVVPPVVPGGKATLGAMAGGAGVIICYEVAEKLGRIMGT